MFPPFELFNSLLCSKTSILVQQLVLKIGHIWFFFARGDNPFHLTTLCYLHIGFIPSIMGQVPLPHHFLSWSHWLITTPPRYLVWSQGRQLYVPQKPFQRLVILAPIGLWVVPWLPPKDYTPMLEIPFCKRIELGFYSIL